MKINKKTLVTVISLIAVVALGIKGKGLLEKRKKQVADTMLPEVAKVSVPVVHAQNDQLTERQRFTATLQSTQSIKLSTKLVGFVKKLYVQESDHVKKGVPLVAIDATEIRSAIEAAEATRVAQQNDFNVAKMIYLRNRELYEAGGLAKEKLDISKAARDAKRAAVENTTQKIAQLKHQLSYLKITAPFDGVIDTLFLHEGDLAASGKPILSMSSDDRKLLFTYAPAQEQKIQKGQKVFYRQKEIATLTTLYNVAKNGLNMAEAQLEDDLHLPIGSSIGIEIQTAQQRGCSLPIDTLLHKKKGTYVMVYHDGRFSPMRVKVQMQGDKKALISPCTKLPIAQASEVKLAALPAYAYVQIVGDEDE